MDLKQSNFTKRTFRSDGIVYNDFLLWLKTGKFINSGGPFSIDIKADNTDNTANTNTNANNNKDKHVDNFDFSKYPAATEVSYIPFNYPNPRDNNFITYGVNLDNQVRPCFTSILRNPFQINDLNINKEGPGSRLGISLQGSKSNIWAFGGYPTLGGAPSSSSSYFFLFNSTSNSWTDKTNLAIKANIPNLVYHTMTNINDEYLIITGGGSFDSNGVLVDSPFSKAYKFNLKQETWTTESLLDCPKNIKLGHTSTMINDKLIVIGGVDNHEESKLNIYSDIISINLNTLKCSQIELKYDNGVSATFQKAFHATLHRNNYFILFSGMYEDKNDQAIILIDTSSWTRKFQYESIKISDELIPQESINQPKSNSNTIIYSLVGVIIFLILVGLISLFYLIRKRKKKRERNNNQSSNSNNNQGQIVEWVRSDSKNIRLNNEEAVFSLEEKNSTGKDIEIDKEADLHQLNSPRLTFKNPNFPSKNSISNNTSEYTGTLNSETLVNNAKIQMDDTILSTDLIKD